jgi:hypothetical protein
MLPDIPIMQQYISIPMALLHHWVMIVYLLTRRQTTVEIVMAAAVPK